MQLPAVQCKDIYETIIYYRPIGMTLIPVGFQDLCFYQPKSPHGPQELLNDTYKHIAEQYEMKGNLKKAEHYYVEACGLFWMMN